MTCLLFLSCVCQIKSGAVTGRCLEPELQMLNLAMTQRLTGESKAMQGYY
jgi:hypothetical protein